MSIHFEQTDSGPADALWFATALLPEGWRNAVRIEMTQGRIGHIECDVAPRPADQRHQIGVPGMGNVHSHAFQRGMAGMSECRRGSDSFWSWRDLMYGFVQRLTPEQLEAISAQAYVEMLEAGFTRVGEFHYLHHSTSGAPYADVAEHADRVCAAAEQVGIGMTLLPVLYTYGGIGAQQPGELQRRFINSSESFSRLLEQARRSIQLLPFGVLGVAAHSIRAVTPEQLQQAAAMLPSAPMHIHIAEQTAEVEQWQSFAGCRPVEWLLDHMDVNQRWCLVHATHMSETETTRLAASGATAGLCPITEANLGDGVFPARAYLNQQGRFGIGTDSNVLIDAAEELRLLEYGQRLIHRERNVLHSAAARSTGRTLFDGALAGGAAALGARTGRLESGYIADIIALSADHPSMTGRTGDALLDTWIFAGADVVDAVWSAGRKVVAGGRHFAREPIAARFASALSELLV